MRTFAPDERVYDKLREQGGHVLRPIQSLSQEALYEVRLDDGLLVLCFSSELEPERSERSASE